MTASRREAFLLAVAQAPITADIGANAATILRFASRAADRGARLVLFSEGALSGYAKAEIADWSAVDWTALDRAGAAIAENAARRGVAIAYGTARRVVGEPRPRNALIIARADGGNPLVYDKRVLSHSERNGWFTAGDTPVLLDMEGWRFGVALCIEVQFPPLFAQWRRLGADAILFPAYARDPAFSMLARAHAATNAVWIAMAVPAAASRQLASAVFGPDGSVLRAAPRGRAGLIDQMLDPDDPRFAVALQKARPWRLSIEAEVSILAARQT